MDPITHALFMAAGKKKQPRWVIGGASGLIMSSDDAETWAARTSPITADWPAGTFSPAFGKFVLVGATSGGNARAIYSEDGENWSTASVPGGPGLVSVAAGNMGTFTPIDGLVAIYNGASTRNIISTDGETWSDGSYTLGGLDNWQSICPGRISGFLALRAASGSEVSVYTGVALNNAWSAMSGTLPGFWSDICYSPDIGLAVAVGQYGGSNRIMTSNLITIGWTARTPPSGSDNWLSICCGKGRFVATSYAKSMVSTNGTTWTAYSMPASRYWQKVAYGDGKFVATGVNAGLTTTYVAVSDDGQSWDEVASFASTGAPIIYGEI
jgi:hypothetical protein